MNKTRSSFISIASRLGAALIILCGRRHIEATRTYGIAMSTSYTNFNATILILPALAIECNNSLQERSAAFMTRSTHKLFEFCTGAIDDDIGSYLVVVLDTTNINSIRYY
jgi:hypothetical protein